MAVTAAGRRLTEAHRVSQVRLSAAIALRIRRLWPALDPADLASTWPAGEDGILALVAAGRVRSAEMAAAYLSAYLTAEGHTPGVPVLVTAIDEARVTTSLRVTGPVSIKQGMARGLSVGQAAQTALGKVAGAATRHVLDAGRETELATALNEGFTRWSRVADGDPCHFCAMLVSRGPVYLTEASGSFESHDRCGCTAEIVVSGDGWTPQARQLRDLWDDATRGEHDQINAFRRAYEAA